MQATVSDPLSWRVICMFGPEDLVPFEDIFVSPTFDALPGGGTLTPRTVHPLHLIQVPVFTSEIVVVPVTVIGPDFL